MDKASRPELLYVKEFVLVSLFALVHWALTVGGLTVCLSQGGMESSVVEFAQEQMAAHDTGAKRFKPLMVLKAKKGKTASGVALARKPGRGTLLDSPNP